MAGGDSGLLLGCVLLPEFALRVLAHARKLELEAPLALASPHEAAPVVVACTAAAAAEGISPGMTVARAMGCCAGLEVVGHDRARVDEAGERFARRLEGVGAAVQVLEPGRVLVEVAGLVALAGGLEGVAARLLGAYRSGDVRLGVAPNPFVAGVAAEHAPPGGWLRIAAGDAARMLAPMSVGLLGADERVARLLAALGIDTLGELAAIDAAHVADRLGGEGLRLHALARGDDPTAFVPRTVADPVLAAIDFPEPVSFLGVLERALEVLAARCCAHPRLDHHAPRVVAVAATLVEGGAWRERRTLRVPSGDPARLAAAARRCLAGLAAPVERLELRLEELAPAAADQQVLLGGRGARLDAVDGMGAAALAGIDDPRVRAGLEHVQATVGEDALLQVLEVDPAARVPERRAMLVPRGGDGGGGSAAGGSA